MKKRAIFIVLSALLLILLSSCVQAFDVETGSVGNVCAGNTIVVTDIVKGTGTFTVNTAGTAKPFSTVVPTGFSLENGAQYLYSYITPSSKTTPGTYDLIVKVTTAGEEKDILHSITVEDCHASDLTIMPQTLETCPCSPVVYTAFLRNRGQYMESYLLSVEGPIKDRVTLSDSVLNINSNDNKTFTIYANTSCDSGKYDFTVKAKATTSMTVNEAKATLDVKPCYEYSIFLPQNYYSICEHDILDIPLTVINEGTSINRILLNFKGPLWSSLTKSSVEINPDARKTVNITLNPGFRDIGNFTISVNAMSEKGYVQKSTEAKINVDTCYGIALNMLNDKDKMCNGISNTYDFTIKNTGKFKNTYNLELKGPEWVSIPEKTVTLDSGEEKTVTISADPSNTALAGTFEVSIKAVDPVSNAISQDSIELSTVTVEDCYKTSINSDTELINVAPDSFTTAVLNIQSIGLRNGSYIIDVSGEAAKYTQLNPGIIGLEPGKAQSLYLYIAPPVDTKEGVYDLTITTRLKDTTVLSSKKLSVNISKLIEVQKPETNQTSENITASQPNFFVDLGDWFVDAFNTVVTFFSNIFTIQMPEAEVPQTNETISENVTVQSNETIAANETIITNDTEIINETVITPSNETATGGNETVNITISENQTVTGNETLNITITNETQTPEDTNETEESAGAGFDLKNFLIENRTYIVGAIIILFLIILFSTGLWKKIINFFEEDEVVEKK